MKSTMPNYKIKCEAVKIINGAKSCPGSAKCKLNEVYIPGPRTPEPSGMCGSDLTFLDRQAFFT
jgi:hypothetical protein